MSKSELSCNNCGVASCVQTKEFGRVMQANAVGSDQSHPVELPLQIADCHQNQNRPLEMYRLLNAIGFPRHAVLYAVSHSRQTAKSSSTTTTA